MMSVTCQNGALTGLQPCRGRRRRRLVTRADDLMSDRFALRKNNISASQVEDNEDWSTLEFEYQPYAHHNARFGGVRIAQPAYLRIKNHHLCLSKQRSGSFSHME